MFTPISYCEAELKAHGLTLAILTASCFVVARLENADAMKVSDIENICRTNNATCRLFIFGLAQV
jgi:hypothetical protein